MEETITTKNFTRYVIQVTHSKPIKSFELNEWGDWHREMEDHYIHLEDAIEKMLHLRSDLKHLAFKVIKRKYTLEESEIE
jgi:hypothetical protein